MASLVSQTTATTAFGDLSLSALENLRYIVSALTTNHEVGQPLNLAEARRFLLDTYFQNLLDPLACSVGNQTPSGTMKSLLEGNFVPKLKEPKNSSSKLTGKSVWTFEMNRSKMKK